MTINDYILIAIAAYLSGGALVIRTHDFHSALLFKLIPFFSAVAIALITFKIV